MVPSPNAQMSPMTSTLGSAEGATKAFDINETINNMEKEIMDPKEAIFERMIIVLPYKAPEMVKQVQTAFD